MIQKGEIIQSSWSSSIIYRVKDITHECCCPTYQDELNLGDKAPKQLPHCHMILDTVEYKSTKSYIGYIDENSLRSVYIKDDYIQVLTQLSVAVISLL